MDSIETFETHQFINEETLSLSPSAKRRRIEKTNNVSRMKNTKLVLNKIGFVFPRFCDKTLEVGLKNLAKHLSKNLKE